MILALNSNNSTEIVDRFKDLGIVLSNFRDVNSVVNIAKTLLDTKRIPGCIVDPFKPGSTLKLNPVVNIPPDLYFLIRTVQLMRGIAYGFDIDFSLAESWSTFAQKFVDKYQ